MTPFAKRLAVLLAVSLGLNLLLGGVMIGRAIQRARHPYAAMGGGPGSRRGAVLPKTFRRPGQEFSARRRATAEARLRVRAALEHDPLDAPALESALATLRSETAKSQELAHQALVRNATQASPEVRRELARAFEDEPPRRR